MRILIAEDESDISHTYRLALESRDHQVAIANDGIRCIEIYREELKKQKEIIKDKKNSRNNNNKGDLRSYKDSGGIISPFDAVVLDYKMPGKDGMEVAKEILDLNQDQ